MTDRISKIEDTAVKFTQSEHQRKYTKKKKINSLRNLWDSNNQSNICSTGIPEAEKKENGAETAIFQNRG